MECFAVIDTETNWVDQVMSIGLVVAQTDTMQPLDTKYYILNPEYQIGGMYEDTLFIETAQEPVICSRSAALDDIKALLHWWNVRSVFAYNASFDRSHLPELRGFSWYDIMRLAAYRQYNPRIPPNAECFSTGRMKRGYGVESMLRILSGEKTYCETHNALDDAMDELEIMRLLGYLVTDYIPLT